MDLFMRIFTIGTVTLKQNQGCYSFRFCSRYCNDTDTSLTPFRMAYCWRCTSCCFS
nr:truncated ORF3a protein [Severe acute respiratory syndrome coronavirus 2]